jgi:hypothetical protein
MNAQSRTRPQLYSFFNLNARWGWVVNGTSRPPYPREQDPIHIVQQADWAQERSGRVRKISPSLGFDNQTAQPTASRYTDWVSESHGSVSKGRIFVAVTCGMPNAKYYYAQGCTEHSNCAVYNEQRRRNLLGSNNGQLQCWCVSVTSQARTGVNTVTRNGGPVTGGNFLTRRKNIYYIPKKDHAVWSCLGLTHTHTYMHTYAHT